MFNHSLSDKLFFPLAFLLAAGMIVLALQPFIDRKPSGPLSGAGEGRDIQNLTVEGDELYRFVAGNVGVLTLKDKSEKRPQTLLHIFLEQREAYDTPLYGPHVVLDSDIERNYEGRRISVTVTARSAAEWGASQMEVNYSTGRFGESGWERFTLTPEFKSYSFEYDVPHTDSSLGQDYLAIRPVVPEKQRAVEVKAIQFKTLSPKRPQK